MKNKIKTVIKIEFDSITILLMSLATVFGMFELTYKNPNKLVFAPSQTSAYIRQNSDQINGNPIRRERDEVDTQYVSYSESQRTFPRAGKY